MTDQEDKKPKSEPCDPKCRGPENDYESHDFIDHYYEGEDCEKSIKIGMSDYVSLSPPLPFRPPQLPIHFRPLQENSQIIALNENVVIEMLSIEEMSFFNQFQNLKNQECVGNFELGGSINSTVTGLIVKGIVVNKGPQIPPDWPVLEGDFVAIRNYSTAFKKNHYVSVSYKSVLNKFNGEFPVALLDKVSVEIFSICETIGSSKSDLLHLSGYEQSINGSAKAIVLSIGSKVPEGSKRILGAGGVFIVNDVKTIFDKRYCTTVNYKSIKTKIE